MTSEEAMNLIAAEVIKATLKFPTWPTRVIDACAVVGEEAGELTKACLQSTYEQDKSGLDEIRMEAIQTGAMAVRFLMSLHSYDFTPRDQHDQ